MKKRVMQVLALVIAVIMLFGMIPSQSFVIVSSAADGFADVLFPLENTSKVYVLIYGGAVSYYKDGGEDYTNGHYGTEYRAVDISGTGAEKGTKVRALEDGKVVRVRSSDGSVFIKYNKPLKLYDGSAAYQEWYSVFAHMQNIQVQTGDTVTRGQKVGEVSNVNAGPVHLHFSLTTKLYNGNDGFTYKFSYTGAKNKDVLKEYSSYTLSPNWINNTYRSITYRSATNDIADQSALNRIMGGTENAPAGTFSSFPGTGRSKDVAYAISATATAVNKSDNTLQDVPYSSATPSGTASNKVINVPAKASLTLTGFTTNEYGNLWYRATYGGKTGWIYKDRITNLRLARAEANIEYYQGYANAYNKGTHITLDGYTKDNSKTGTKDISTRGTIRFESGVINRVSACIYKVTGNNKLEATSNKANVTPNAKSYTLGSEAIDNAMYFRSLPAGTYRYIIGALVEPYKELGIKSGWYTVADSTFTVTDGSTTTEQKNSLVSFMNQLRSAFSALINSNGTPELTKSTSQVVYTPVDLNSLGSVTISTRTGSYSTGIYKIIARDGLNFRAGAGTNYAKLTSPLPYGTQIEVTEISSNGWGKTTYMGYTGWLAMNYCQFVRAFPVIQKPATTSAALETERDIAKGAAAKVTWHSVSDADTYTVYMKNSSGAVVKSLTGVRGTEAYFTADIAGTYYFTVFGVNSLYSGDECAPTASFTAHDPSTVSFVYRTDISETEYEDKIETRSVPYGGSATAPTPPTREGYTFTGWDRSYSNVTSDITVTAQYKINSYSVKFVRVFNGQTTILKNEKVDYLNAATPPEDTETPQGYVFVTWNSQDYTKVKSNQTIYAVYQWANPNLPVEILDSPAPTATRINKGYIVTFSLRCTDAEVTNGRVIVSLKTAQGKQIVTTESAAFSLASGTNNKSMEIYVPSSQPASVAEFYVVESFGRAIPISQTKSCTIDLHDQWSDWSTTKPADNTYDQLEQNTEYRYRTKSFTTDTTKTKSGWTLYDTTSTTSSGTTYNAISSFSTDAQVRKVTTSTEPVYSTWYRYQHYTNGGYHDGTGKYVTWNSGPYYNQYHSSYGHNYIGPHYIESATRLTNTKYDDMWNCNAFYPYTCPCTVSNARYSNQSCLNTWFYNETPFQKQTGTKTKYSYTDTFYTYYFYKWSDWSTWGTTAQTESSTKEVQTRPIYRYKNEGLGVEDNSGIERIASSRHNGLLEQDIPLPKLMGHEGESVTLYIYKYNEASDFTGEYIGQTTVDENGDYSFSFILREEPTAETGDFMVSIGLEGSKETINVGRIIAPKPSYKVVFRYADPSDKESEYQIADTQTVTEGSAVTAPANPEFTGYKFLGWDTDLSYITETKMFVEYGEETEEKIITFTARYEPEEYVVVFMCGESAPILRRYHYGEDLLVPTVATEEGYDLVWDGLEGENMTVTGDMVISARFEKKIYEVNFYGYDGELIETQYVPYNEMAADVDLEESDNYVFQGWEYRADNFVEDENGNTVVDENGNAVYLEDPVVNFYPTFVFAQNTAEPTSSLEDGTYNAVQTVTLSCETEGAVIYYTLDGSDPKETLRESNDVSAKVIEYTEPFQIDRSCVLKYYACAFEHNDSDVMTNYYAVNANVMESNWMLQEELPDYVAQNAEEYNLQSATGYRYKDTIETASLSQILNYEKAGWTEEEIKVEPFGDEYYMTEPSIDDMDYEVETTTPPAEQQVRYVYHHYVYNDAQTGEPVYVPEEPADVESTYETVLTETKLQTAGYYGGARIPYVIYNGVRWFGGTITTVDVVPDYMLYRYRLRMHVLSKWTDWTTDEPSENEERQTQTDTVFNYKVPEMCVVEIVSDASTFDAKTKKYLLEVNELLNVDESEYEHEGYDFLGFFKDPKFRTFFNHKTTPVTENMTLYPKYRVHTFSVQFFDYDGTVLSESIVNYGDFADVPTEEQTQKEGYVFVGWDQDDYTFVTQDLILTAQYVPESEYCTVSLNYNKYSMMAGTSFHLTAEVTPEEAENKNLIWRSSDTTIAEVNDEGTVTAINAGVVTIYAETEATGQIAECIVTVIKNPADSLSLKSDSSLAIYADNELLRASVSIDDVWTVTEIKQEFENEQSHIEIIGKSGDVLSDSDQVGTGAVVRLMVGTDVKDEITVIITGDMNGDGKVNTRDVSMITRFLVDKETADYAQMCAIDVNGDGEVNVRDASMVARYLVGKEII